MFRMSLSEAISPSLFLPRQESYWLVEVGPNLYGERLGVQRGKTGP
jgi:hypothetical protein